MERGYWAQMRNHLRKTTGCDGLLLGSQLSFSPAGVQAEFDAVCDNACWNHPAYLYGALFDGAGNPRQTGR
jgi:hypothetical protein